MPEGSEIEEKAGESGKSGPRDIGDREQFQGSAYYAQPNRTGKGQHYQRYHEEFEEQAGCGLFHATGNGAQDLQDHRQGQEQDQQRHGQFGPIIDCIKDQDTAGDERQQKPCSRERIHQLCIGVARNPAAPPDSIARRNIEQDGVTRSPARRQRQTNRPGIGAEQYARTRRAQHACDDQCGQESRGRTQHPHGGGFHQREEQA